MGITEGEIQEALLNVFPRVWRGCPDDQQFDRQSTASATDATRGAAYRRANAMAIEDVNVLLAAFRRAAGDCPDGCEPTPRESRRLVWSSPPGTSCTWRWRDWVLSKIPGSGVGGGYTCTVTHRKIIDFECEPVAETPPEETE
ncbi:hypothetical protein DU500_05795 [Haloplanus rubicundus]|uniref:Uncharacterized protein n=1 Tax=Haloplanus rubicundus TaxID=1547898 RepID=A0A345EAW8_9EURY|nr:hypothetical protein [Haloplanus rubicundus]AXG05994.1 hypothetical protein DU500_05795 [Haloplanus rubicundus]AXG09340.1 hypothetical protein DU484_05350 [Haloplanus rubicundus]